MTPVILHEVGPPWRGRPGRSAVDRLWEKSARDASGCVVWGGAVNESGYGLIGVRGRSQLAHRASWVARYGAIPAGLIVCHRCDNPPCINPDHLFLGTDADNVADCVSKGRRNTLRGTALPQAKLDADRVRRIRDLGASGWKQRDIARTFGVSKSMVGNILRRQDWAHVA